MTDEEREAQQMLELAGATPDDEVPPTAKILYAHLVVQCVPCWARGEESVFEVKEADHSKLEDGSKLEITCPRCTAVLRQHATPEVLEQYGPNPEFKIPIVLFAGEEADAVLDMIENPGAGEVLEGPAVDDVPPYVGPTVPNPLMRQELEPDEQ